MLDWYSLQDEFWRALKGFKAANVRFNFIESKWNNYLRRHNIKKILWNFIFKCNVRKSRYTQQSRKLVSKVVAIFKKQSLNSSKVASQNVCKRYWLERSKFCLNQTSWISKTASKFFLHLDSSENVKFVQITSADFTKHFRVSISCIRNWKAEKTS